MFKFQFYSPLDSLLDNEFDTFYSLSKNGRSSNVIKNLEIEMPVLVTVTINEKLGVYLQYSNGNENRYICNKHFNDKTMHFENISHKKFKGGINFKSYIKGLLKPSRQEVLLSKPVFKKRKDHRIIYHDQPKYIEKSAIELCHLNIDLFQYFSKENKVKSSSRNINPPNKALKRQRFHRQIKNDLNDYYRSDSDEEPIEMEELIEIEEPIEIEEEDKVILKEILRDEEELNKDDFLTSVEVTIIPQRTRPYTSID